MSKTLLQKNTRYLFLWLPVVLLFCSILFYIAMQMQAHHMQLKQLQLKQLNTWNSFVENNDRSPMHLKGEYDVTEITPDVKIDTTETRDTSLYYADFHKNLPFQILTGKKNLGGKTYLITTYVSSTEINHLIIKVFIAEVIILLLLLLTIVILNRKTAGLLWHPFFDTVKKVKTFDIVSNTSLKLDEETGTKEFNELNTAVNELIGNVNAAYFHQKQFVENASHEMQTPLAVIRSKLELLINQPNITEKSAALLSDITEVNDRLSQMNRTLLLLAKIENNQFPETEDVDVSAMLSDTINNFRGYNDNFPETEEHIAKGIVLHANRSLIEILITNLVKNAIEHNIDGGKIKLHLSPSSITIENTGPPLQAGTQELFERFKKGSYQSKTTGLGLAMVKQICTLYHYSVNYVYTDGWHKVAIRFY